MQAIGQNVNDGQLCRAVRTGQYRLGVEAFTAQLSCMLQYLQVLYVFLSLHIGKMPCLMLPKYTLRKI